MFTGLVHSTGKVSGRSDSRITSAENASPVTAVAVRQTPLTATESPSRSSPASAVSTSIRAPSPSGSTRSTVPVLSTRPVNITTP